MLLCCTTPLLLPTSSSQGIYSPSAPQSRALNTYKQDLSQWAGASYGLYNATLQGFQPASEAGLLKTLPYSEWQKLNETVQTNYLKIQPITNISATVSKNGECLFWNKWGWRVIL
jgi:hypothetical protein